MPKEYEEVKKEYIDKGESAKEAAGTAARIYNAKIRPKVGGPAMGPGFEKRAREWKRKKQSS